MTSLLDPKFFNGARDSPLNLSLFKRDAIGLMFFSDFFGKPYQGFED